MNVEGGAAALLDALDSAGVAYVIVGSVAASAHGVPDLHPADLDVVPAPDASNLAALASALDSLHAEPEPAHGAWQIDDAGEHVWVEDGKPRPPAPLDAGMPSSFDHSFQTPHGRLDVVPQVAGPYAELRPRAALLEVAGTRRWVASRHDLLARLTRPRRPKDGPAVRHLRAEERSATGSGIGFIGFRTDRFEEMVALFRDRIGLEVILERDGATWFRLGSDAELHVYVDSDTDHRFFTTGPVVGLRVPDVDATRAELEADGLEMLTEIERTDAAAWCHFRAPDGTVLEIIGPA